MPWTSGAFFRLHPQLRRNLLVEKNQLLLPFKANQTPNDLPSDNEKELVALLAQLLLHLATLPAKKEDDDASRR